VTNHLAHKNITLDGHFSTGSTGGCFPLLQESVVILIALIYETWCVTLSTVTF